MKYLFIGGSADGEFIDVPETLPVWAVKSRTSLPITHSPKELAPLAEMTVTRYIKQELTDDAGNRHFVFTLPNYDIIRALLVGYKGENNAIKEEHNGIKKEHNDN